MAGVLLTAIAWQLLAVARDRARPGARASHDIQPAVDELRRRVDALERR